MKITLDSADILYTIIGYLNSAGYHHTTTLLEQESNTTPYQYGRDVTFARELTLGGRWEDLVKFLEPLKRSNFDYERALFEIDKQRFLEMLNAMTATGQNLHHYDCIPTSEGLVAKLKELEGRCDQETFHGLCFCLTVKTLRNHPEYTDWSVYGGRTSLFDQLLHFMSPVFPDQVIRRGRSANMPDDHLVTLLQQSVTQQMSEWKYANPNARVPEEFYAGLLKGEFTYQKGGGEAFQDNETASSRIGEFDPRSAQSMPSAQGLSFKVEQTASTELPRAPIAKAANEHRHVEEAPGFYKPDEPDVNERFDPPMDVEYFPKAVVKPPVKWEINLDEDAVEEENEAAKETTPDMEAERRLREAAEFENQQPNVALPPPVNPEDPYSHFSTEETFLEFCPVSSLVESHPIRTVSWSPEGTGFCVGTNSKALRICRLEEEDGVASIRVLHERSNHHAGSVYCSSWNCEGRLIATGSNDKCVKVVRTYMDSDDPNLDVVGSSLESDDVLLKGHGGTVRDVQFHLEDCGRLLSVGAHDNLCNVWDIVGTSGADYQPVRSFMGHEATVYCGRFSSFDSNLLATGSADNTVKLWDLRSVESDRASISVDVGSPILSLLWSGKFNVVSSHADGSVRELDVRTGKEVSVIQAHQDECRSLDATPCGRFICTGGFDGLASIFKIGEGTAPDFVASLRMRSGGRILSAKWRPRGGQGVLLAGADCTVTYWGKKENLN